MQRRIIIVGTSGSGKSTLGREISKKLGIPSIELDTLFWQPNWVRSPLEVFIEKIDKLTNQKSWVIDGNYSQVRHITFTKGDTLIWLDYPFYLIFYRAFKRSFCRIFKKEKLWGTNYETLSRFFSKNSILVWVIQTHRKRKKTYTRIINQGEYSNLHVIRLKSPKETKELLKNMEKNVVL
ncbi:MAG: adenylate kinase [Alphaproteobacteria bacterium]|nr:adenylate kinase [Alphaproteobacteria bacterium]